MIAASIWDVRAAPSEPRIALVVGNAAYRNAPPLKNPVNDARDMAKALRELGFEVIEVENASKQQLEHAIGQFSAKLREGSVGLFYYSGHGLQENGHNYLIPVDAELAHETSVMLETVDVDVVLQLMNMAQTRVNLVILDACRSNPFERRFRALGRGLAPIEEAPQGTLVAYSTSPGKVASDGSGANGLYTAELLKAIRMPGLKVEEVFKTVRIAVSKASNEDQIPWEMSSLTGDFYFRQAGLTPDLSAPQRAPVQPAAIAPASAAQAVQSSTAAAPLAPQTALTTSPGAPVSSADEIAFHCPAPGTVVHYNTGADITFSSDHGFRCAYTDGSGRVAEKFAAFADDEKFLDAGLKKLWPMKVGTEQSFAINVSGTYLAERYTVLRRESVTIPAGTFDTFIVEWDEKGRGLNGVGEFGATRLFWYAPALGLVIKSTARITGTNNAGLEGGAASGGDYQATRIVTPGGVAGQ